MCVVCVVTWQRGAPNMGAVTGQVAGPYGGTNTVSATHTPGTRTVRHMPSPRVAQPLGQSTYTIPTEELRRRGVYASASRVLYLTALSSATPQQYTPISVQSRAPLMCPCPLPHWSLWAADAGHGRCLRRPCAASPVSATTTQSHAQQHSSRGGSGEGA